MFASCIAESLSDGRLRITETPEYLFGIGFGLPAVIGMVFFVYRAYRVRSGGPLIAALICSCFLYIGLRGMNTGSLTLDRAGNTAYFHEPTKLWHTDYTVPLDQIHFAEVRSVSVSSYISVVLNDGDSMSFGDPNQTPGKGRAAHAINQYIGYTAR